MSAENQEPNQESKKPEAAAAKPAAPAAAAAAAKPAEPPPPPEPGEYGQRLEKAGIGVTHLGKDALGVEMVQFDAANFLKGVEHLRDAEKFDLLMLVTGVDWKTHRQSVYHFYSLDTHQSVIVKIDAETRADGKDYSPSLMSLFPAADWHERESYDLVGIHYEGHPNLQRILMPNDWIGHPLRKDYKVDDPRLVWNER